MINLRKIKFIAKEFDEKVDLTSTEKDGCFHKWVNHDEGYGRPDGLVEDLQGKMYRVSYKDIAFKELPKESILDS